MLRPDDPHQLWRRYALALGVVVALLGASHWASLRALSGGEEAAAVINVSGHQRMPSQRILYFASDALTHPREVADPRRAVTGAADPERAAAWDRMRRDGLGPPNYAFSVARHVAADVLPTGWCKVARSTPWLVGAASLATGRVTLRRFKRT